jgi:Ser/Thr protein kinase RdoA (MazF antagonist)
MEKRIKDRYNDSIFQQVRQFYGIGGDDIRLLDGFESFIYEFDREERGYILRIGHSLRRSENLIRGEVDWINYLHHGGASVSKAILTVKGDLVAVVADDRGGHFLATAFEKAAGNPVTKEQWDDGLYERYGRLIGRMHALTKTYKPEDPAWVRPEWDDPEMLEIQGWLPESESLVVEKYLELKSHLDSLPKSKESYGLIHQDTHAGNFFIDEDGKITLFDFDDCTYSWLINDIAIVLFYIALGVEDQIAFTREFMTHFMRGYRAENQLDEEWLIEIPSFLKLREIDLYAVIHRSFDVENIDHPWVAMFMKDRKSRIENEIPFIDFDFMTLKLT